MPNSEVRRRKVVNPADAFKEFGANLVVKGSVQRDGTDIRLTINLIDAKNLRQIGSADLTVAENCVWCYDDPSGCFPLPPKGFLPPGPCAPGDYGPYTPTKTGKVTFNASTGGAPCDLTLHRHRKAGLATAHVIVIG